MLDKIHYCPHTAYMMNNDNISLTSGRIVDDVLFEMEERGCLPMMKGDFNLVDEIRSYLGEAKFYEILEHTNRMWDMELDTIKE